MRRGSWSVLRAVACAALGMVSASRHGAASPEIKDERPAASKAAPGEEIFGLTRVHDLHLTIAAKDYETMQPSISMPFPGGPGGPPQTPKPDPDANADVHKRSGPGPGPEFPWARGDLTEAGQTYKDVGVRYKGNFTYMASAGGLRRSLKLDFDHYREDGRFHGLKKLNLNSGVTDPARTREAFSFAVFRAAGVPSPRTAYAQLTLTVPGKYDREYVGLYTLIEQMDKDFLKEHFSSAKGLLLKPEGVRGLEYLGEDWKPYAERYLPKDKVDPKQQRRLIEFARLVNWADDARFSAEIGSYLDVDVFLRFLAANALIVNLDSFLAFGHNYYLYLRPDTHRFVFIPWDLDLSFGTWPMGGSPEQQMDLSITHPHQGDNKLIDRLLADKGVAARYRKLLGELAVTCFAKDESLREIDAVESVIKEPLAREQRVTEARKEGTGGPPFGPPGRGMFDRSPSLRTFVVRRAKSVAAQLAGESKGYVPVMGPGPGGFPRPGEILPPFLQGVLKFTDEQRQHLGDLQKDVDRRLDEILNDEQKKQLKQMREGPGPGGPPRP